MQDCKSVIRYQCKFLVVLCRAAAKCYTHNEKICQSLSSTFFPTVSKIQGENVSFSRLSHLYFSVSFFFSLSHASLSLISSSPDLPLIIYTSFHHTFHSHKQAWLHSQLQQHSSFFDITFLSEIIRQYLRSRGLQGRAFKVSYLALMLEPNHETLPCRHCRSANTKIQPIVGLHLRLFRRHL